MDPKSAIGQEQRWLTRSPAFVAALEERLAWRAERFKAVGIARQVIPDANLQRELMELQSQQPDVS